MIHKETERRWQTLSLCEQMGNAGSEVERAIARYEKKDMEYFEKAFERALELLDLTIADPRWVKGRRELTRAREILCDVFYGENHYGISFEYLKKYFLQFAIASRNS